MFTEDTTGDSGRGVPTAVLVRAVGCAELSTETVSVTVPFTAVKVVFSVSEASAVLLTVETEDGEDP